MTADLPASFESPAVLVLAALAALAAGHYLGRLMLALQALPDIPNARSSHRRITPRSGGVAVFGGWAVGMTIAVSFSGARAAEMFSAALFVALVGVAFLLGLSDDKSSLRARTKFLTQILIAILFVAMFGALDAAPLPAFGWTALGALAAPVSVLWIVAAMNAFNFMDGVDGIAAACGALVLAALAIVAARSDAPFWAAAAALGAVSLAGFLPFNFPAGRIFLGDNGSQAAGFLIAAAALGASRAAGETPLALFAPVAMAPFLVDVAFTLAHRAIRRQNIFAAHREHAYQLLVRLGWRHAQSTAAFVALTAFSAGAAVLMLALAPSAQWIVPASLVLLCAAFAGAVFRRAQRAGLLADRRAAQPAPAEGAVG